MRRAAPFAFLSFSLALLLLGFAPSVSAQGHGFTPKSTLPQPDGPAGRMARTHLRMYVPAPQKMTFGAAVQPNELPPFPGYIFETPASIGCIYHLVPNPIPGCNPNATTENPSGGSRVIAVVDAFDDPTAASDLATFSAQFGLPPASVTVVYLTGSEPNLDPSGSWELEESTDLQMAHAMAPGANLILVETPDNSFANLFDGTILAGELVAAAGGGEVSISWGHAEFSEETEVDAVFTLFPGVVYVASSGDAPGVEYPSASPYVVSAGGTTISRNVNTGNFILETTWQDGGSGPSQFEPRPQFQNFVRYIVGNSRGTPDVSFDANLNTGVWVFDTNAVYGTGWYVVGGTSVSAPALAGIINAAGRFHNSSQDENQEMYRHIFFDNGDFRDITYGNCGLNIGTFALPGYDLCTGLGSDLGLRGK